MPARIAWAVELLDLRPTDRVLEVGCGPGVAASLVVPRLAEGWMTAIDRSPTAVARTRARNADHVRTGRLTVVQGALADFAGDERVRFDKAFAVDVNVFWTTPADAECRALRAVLATAASVHLIYGGPRDVSEPVAATLTGHGFATTVRRGPAPGMACVTGVLD